jgi:diketogulonate reductase-like aldo/keto reductase
MTQQASDLESPVAEGMPMLGLGTWQNDEHDQCAETVRTALEAGYRHVDTAQVYDNEVSVGDGLAAADVDREDVFLATKVWISNLSHGDVRATTMESLERLGTEYVDLLYVHWPARQYDPMETLPAFAELRDEGHVERIGVSNFEPHHLQAAEDVLGEYPFANQVELHPLLQQPELREYCAEHGVQLVAYSPLARGRVFDLDVLTEIAETHGVSEAQVVLAWLREHGVAAIPKATGEEHILDNWRSLGLELDAEELDRIDAIDREDRRVHPEFAPNDW